jgi:hypothetical protein
MAEVFKGGQLSGAVFLVVAGGTVRAQDATPTFSIEAVEVNGIAVPGGQVKEVAVAPGDVITAKFFVRDWSPGGEKLRAYQIKLDDASFATGDEGVVQPVDFQMNPEKDPNAFIDESDPLFVHRGRQTIPLVDTVSLGYRWLSVLLDAYDGPVSSQDGKKFACGTVKLTPSPNAKGEFNVAVVEDPLTTSLITTDNVEVAPINYEKLKVKVSRDARWRRLVSSNPPDGAVDARRSLKAGSSEGSWDKIQLSFNCESGNLDPSELSIEDGTSNPPRIKSVKGDGSEVTVELDRPVRAGGWTTIRHKPSKTQLRVGSFPGDVNGDGRANSEDVQTIIRALNGAELLPLHRSDVDRNGVLGSGDLLTVLDLVATSSTASRTR